MSGNDNYSETVRTSAVSTTIALSDFDLLVLGSTGNTVVTIPLASAFPPGRTFRIYKDAAAFTCTITPTGPNLIDGAATKVLAASAAHAAHIVTDGTNWFSTASY